MEKQVTIKNEESTKSLDCFGNLLVKKSMYRDYGLYNFVIL